MEIEAKEMLQKRASVAGSTDVNRHKKAATQRMTLAPILQHSQSLYAPKQQVPVSFLSETIEQPFFADSSTAFIHFYNPLLKNTETPKGYHFKRDIESLECISNVRSSPSPVRYREFHSRRDIDRAPLVHPETLLLPPAAQPPAKPTTDSMLHNTPCCPFCRSTNLVYVPQCRFCGHVKVLDKPTSDVKKMGHHLIQSNPHITAAELLDNIVGLLSKHSCEGKAKDIEKPPQDDERLPKSVAEVEKRKSSARKEDPPSPQLHKVPSVHQAPSPASMNEVRSTSSSDDEKENEIAVVPSLMESGDDGDQMITCDLVYRFQKLIAKGQVPGPHLREALIRYMVRLVFTPPSALSKEQRLDEQDMLLEILKGMMVRDVEGLVQSYAEWLDATSSERQSLQFKIPSAQSTCTSISFASTTAPETQPRGGLSRTASSLPASSSSRSVSASRRTTLIQDKYKAVMEDRKRDQRRQRGGNHSDDNIRVMIQSNNFILDEETILSKVEPGEREKVQSMSALERELYYVISDEERARFFDMAEEEKQELRASMKAPRSALLAAMATKGELLTDTESESILSWNETDKNAIAAVWQEEYQRRRRSAAVATKAPLTSSCYIPPIRVKSYGFHMPATWERFMRRRKMAKHASLPLDQMQALILEIYLAKESSSESLCHCTMSFFKKRYAGTVLRLKMTQFIQTLQEHYLSDLWCNQYARFCGVLNSLPATCLTFYLDAFKSLKVDETHDERMHKFYRFQLTTVKPFRFSRAASSIRALCSEFEIDVTPWIDLLIEKKVIGTLRSNVSAKSGHPRRLAVIDATQFMEIVIELWECTQKRRETDLRVCFVRFDEYHTNALTFPDFESFVRSFAAQTPPRDDLPGLTTEELHAIFERCLPNPRASAITMDSFVTAAFDIPVLLTYLGLGKVPRARDVMKVVSAVKIVSLFRKFVHLKKQRQDCK